ncbi:hypothetical protein LCGC14_0658120 [marine sediment metagenome]|uniref:Calcineurin-like phosphoesterase domain-containing protein n=1 Tax=marine sediment metagenome TaxID=412755 RepID=A0A0F9U2Q7_9ZZZZ
MIIAMKFAVLADAHIGRRIPLAIAEHRRLAFKNGFSKAVDIIVEEGCDYVFLCGDLFERRTLKPELVQFAHDELYRIVDGTRSIWDKPVKIFLIRGNHDGRPQSDTLDYLKHPLAEYLHVFEEDSVPFVDENLTVVGLNYYDRVEAAYTRLAEQALKEASGLKIFMFHGFVAGYNKVPPYSSSLTLDRLAEADPAYVFTGHYHLNCGAKRLPNGGWILTPGSLEKYDFAENPEKGLYIIEHGEDPRGAGGDTAYSPSKEPIFTWRSIEPLHIMKQVNIDSERRRDPSWYSEQILEKVELFSSELAAADKSGYLRVRVRGSLRRGFVNEIDQTKVDEIVKGDPRFLWLDVDTLGVEMPIAIVTPNGSPSENLQEVIASFFLGFEDFAEDIGEMYVKAQEALEETASEQTGLLTSSQRGPFVDEWVSRFEGRRFRRLEI